MIDGLVYIYPVLGSMLSVAAAFVAVYWVLNNTKRYSPLAMTLYSLIAAVIVAVAEIGLYLISIYKRQSAQKKWQRREARYRASLEEAYKTPVSAETEMKKEEPSTESEDKKKKKVEEEEKEKEKEEEKKEEKEEKENEPSPTAATEEAKEEKESTEAAAHPISEPSEKAEEKTPEKVIGDEAASKEAEENVKERKGKESGIGEGGTPKKKGRKKSKRE